jgi:hypothetical protein
VYTGLLIGLLALAACLIHRSRLAREVGGQESVLSDDMIRQIESSGWIEVDEPLDHREIREEEARFWEEPWDEPDER